MLNSLTTICLIYFWGYVLSINYFPILILELMRQHSNYLRFRISIDYHFRNNQKRQLCRFFILFYLLLLLLLLLFFRVRRNNILTYIYILFYVLNFPKRYVLDLR
jgi:hypothetical protein